MSRSGAYVFTFAQYIGILGLTFIAKTTYSISLKIGIVQHKRQDQQMWLYPLNCLCLFYSVFFLEKHIEKECGFCLVGRESLHKWKVRVGEIRGGGWPEVPQSLCCRSVSDPKNPGKGDAKAHAFTQKSCCWTWVALAAPPLEQTKKGMSSERVYSFTYAVQLKWKKWKKSTPFYRQFHLPS